MKRSTEGGQNPYHPNVAMDPIVSAITNPRITGVDSDPGKSTTPSLLGYPEVPKAASSWAGEHFQFP